MVMPAADSSNSAAPGDPGVGRCLAQVLRGTDDVHVPVPVPEFDPEALRAARRQAGLTQVELAAKLGTDGNRVSQWERGAHRPSPTWIGVVANALGVHPAVITGGATVQTLAVLRRRAGLTQDQLGALVGVGGSTINRLERGKTKLSAALELELAVALNVTVAAVRRGYARSRIQRRPAPAGAPKGVRSDDGAGPPPN